MAFSLGKGRNLVWLEFKFYEREWPRKSPKVMVSGRPWRFSIHKPRNLGFTFEPEGGWGQPKLLKWQIPLWFRRISADCERIGCNGERQEDIGFSGSRERWLVIMELRKNSKRLWQYSSASRVSVMIHKKCQGVTIWAVTSLVTIWECPFDRMDSNKIDHMKIQCCDFRELRPLHTKNKSWTSF